jgi:hypothetical protein
MQLLTNNRNRMPNYYARHLIDYEVRICLFGRGVEIGARAGGGKRTYQSGDRDTLTTAIAIRKNAATPNKNNFYVELPTYV